MKEYKITMTFSLESEDADYEKISEFAEDLSDRLMNDEKLNKDLPPMLVNSKEENINFFNFFYLKKSIIFVFRKDGGRSRKQNV